MSTAVARWARARPGFDDRLARTLAVLATAAQRHPGRIVQATSLGAEDMVVTDLIAHHRLPIAIATLDTGALHAETLALLPAIAGRYGIDVEVWRPQAAQVLHFVRSHGADAMRRSVELRKSCCAVRKLEPLQRMLAGRDAWITGLRREQSDARASAAETQSDGAGRVKWNPLVEWSQADVWHYIGTRDVPYNALHDAHYPSIGCAPCTRAVAAGEDERAGRWWWELGGSQECGLHAQPVPA